MTTGEFPLRIRPLSSWNGTSRMQCRPSFRPEGPRWWLSTRSSRMYPPDGQDVVAHEVLPTTAGTGLLTGVFTQQLPRFGGAPRAVGMNLQRCRPDVVLEAKDGAGRGGLLPGTEAGCMLYWNEPNVALKASL